MFQYLFPLASPSLPPCFSHPSRWSQSTELISLYYAAASHQLSILRLVVYICPCHSLTLSQITIPPIISSSPFSSRTVSLFPSCHQVLHNIFFSYIPDICVSIQYLFFSFRLTSLCMTDSWSIHLTTNNSISFLFMAE